MTSERLFCLGCQIDFLVGDPLEARCPGCGRHYSAYSGPLVRERSLALALWREQNPHAAFSSPPPRGDLGVQAEEEARPCG
ncbi:hypothetical protein TK90_2690 (plasmid) [Thioalkalivibrio sp. K90mix]|nr:hypothetical protein TK90_2690 [Thioalkalivibrio sp. K90mix]